MIYNVLFIVLLLAAAFCAWRISVADWRRRIIPDIYLFPLLLIGLIVVHFFPYIITAGDAIIAAFFGYFLSAIIGQSFKAIKNKKKQTDEIPIGMGDIKLMATGGIWLGTTGLAATLVITCIAGLIWGKYKKQKFIPFAPFFIASGILTLIVMMFLI